MRPASPRRQRTPKISINLTNCKYDLCECFTASSAPENSLPIALSRCCALLQVTTSKAVSLTLSSVLNDLHLVARVCMTLHALNCAIFSYSAGGAVTAWLA